MINFHFDFYEIIVWVATILLCGIAAACKNAPLRKRGGLGQPLPNPIAVILPIVFFTVFAACRKNVGDTVYYVLSFEGYTSSNNPVTAEMFFTEMFLFFQNLIRNMTEDAQWLVAFSSIFAIPMPLIILYKYSYPFDLSLYLFVTYGYVGGMMNGMRQYMAAAIVLCGTKYLFSLKKTSFIKYAVIIMLAWSMHNSALIMLPLFFVVRRKAWTFSSYAIILGSVVATVAFDAILPSFLGALEDTSYGVYAQNGWFTNGEEGGSSIGRALVTFYPVVIAYMNKDRMKRLGHIGDVLTNLAFINIAIGIISTYNWIFTRVAIYLMVYFMIFTAWVVTCAVPPKDKQMYYCMTIVGFFLYSRFLSYQIAGYMSDYFFPGRRLFRR
ncbi:MAG: EpsG family protein [Clostridia bacterium]|nr:EpsG family protein [Clostridia bacterium]